jgi:uncharacterized protein (DUF952 family)
VTSIVVGASRQLWDAAQETGQYVPADFDAEGFIHASTPQQLAAVAEKHYRGRSDLVLLYISTERVRAEIRYEGRPGGEQYPHIYGPLNVDAVVRTLELRPAADGSYIVPQPD